MENMIKNEVLNALMLGTIQPFQIEDTLRLKGGFASFEIERLSREIRVSYEKMHPCY